jgi:hypothetical protein
MVPLVCILLAATLACPALADVIKIATWNIEHVRDTDIEDPKSRHAAKFYLLGDYTLRLNAKESPTERERNSTSNVALWLGKDFPGRRHDVCFIPITGH